MTTLRIGIGMFYHESHSFVPYKTGIPQFEEYGYYEKTDLINAFRNTKTELGAFIDILEKEVNIEIVPLLCAAAIPSGIVTMEAYETIESQMSSLLEKEDKLDAILIALHGAMVVENLQDPEERFLKKLREIVGNIPIATTLDMHANIKESYTNLAEVHIGYKTYPHVDMYETGVIATQGLLNMLKGVTYKTNIKKLNLMPPSINMRTAEGPMHTLIDRSKYWEQQSGIFNISILGGFPYADVEQVGATIIVIGTVEAKINKAMEDLIALFEEVKDEFLVHLPTIPEAISKVENYEGEKPIVLADIADNPLSCGSADTTELIRAVIHKKIPNCLIGGICDIESIEKCLDVGIGNTVTIELGGKTSPEYGLPIEMKVEVINITDGVFLNSGPYQQNYTMDLKKAVHVRHNEIDILLTGRPMSANDPEMFRHIGIEPTNKKILVLKAKNHFRAAFEPLVGEIVYVDAPGATSNYLRNFAYKNIPNNIWPLNLTDY